MSKISTVYDQLLTTLAALYPNKSRLINAYDPEDNPDGLLRDGYGLKLGDAPIVNDEFCNFSSDRLFSIVLTREVLAIGEVTPVDAATKLMLEDIYTAQKDFSNADQIGIESSIEKIDLGTSSGVTYFVGEKIKFISMEFSVNIQVTETI